MGNPPRNRRGEAVKFFLISVLTATILLGVLVGAIGTVFAKRIHQPGPLLQNQLVWVKQGMSVPAIAHTLQRDGVVRDSFSFEIAARLRRVTGKLQAGEYEIPAGASIDDVITALIDGKPYLHFLTIPEGLTSQQILQRVGQDTVLVGAVGPMPDEGSLLPETYGFTRGETRAGFVVRMAQAQAAALATLWEQRDRTIPLNTPYEAVILASIVEKETGQDAERARVASVFINRLRKRMRLQSDVTVIYGLSGGEPLGRGLRKEELRQRTPYNTYTVTGLPPTPIANPGREAIRAVLNPEKTDDLYFVADGTGGHAFSKTLKEHRAHVRKWRQIEKARHAPQSKAK